MSLVHIFVLWRQIVDVTWRITHWLVIRVLFNCLHASTWNDVVITIRCQLYKRSDNDFKKLHLLFMLLNVLIFFPSSFNVGQKKTSFSSFLTRVRYLVWSGSWTTHSLYLHFWLILFFVLSLSRVQMDTQFKVE